MCAYCWCLNSSVHQQKDNPPILGMHRSKSKHELKLLEKIPENAEATVVLVGELNCVEFFQEGTHC